MQEIVWVFGNSASGKETFIRHITDQQSQDLLKALGWSGKKISHSDASLKFIGQYKGDTLVEQRESLIQETVALARESDVVLIKWQSVDGDLNRIAKLKSLLPESKHHVIYLVAPSSDLAERLPKKSWWNKKDSKDVFAYIARESDQTDNEINSLDSNLQVTKVMSLHDYKFELDSPAHQ